MSTPVDYHLNSPPATLPLEERLNYVVREVSRILLQIGQAIRDQAGETRNTPSFMSDVDMKGHRITNLGDATVDLDAVNRKVFLQILGQEIGKADTRTDEKVKNKSETTDLSDYFFLPGRSGGQTAAGGTAAGNPLTLRGTSNGANDGPINLNDLGGGVTVGGGAKLTKYLSGTATWDPPNLAADGDVTTTTVAVTGAAVGDCAIAGHSQITQTGVILTALPTSADTVTVVLLNKTGGALNVASGTLRVVVFKTT